MFFRVGVGFSPEVDARKRAPLTPRERYARGTDPRQAKRLPLHTVYMSADSIGKALADPVDEPEEVLAIAAAA